MLLGLFEADEFRDVSLLDMAHVANAQIDEEAECVYSFGLPLPCALS